MELFHELKLLTGIYCLWFLIIFFGVGWLAEWKEDSTIPAFKVAFIFSIPLTFIIWAFFI